MVAAARADARRIGSEAESRAELRRARAREDVSELIELARLRARRIDEDARADAARRLDIAQGEVDRMLNEAYGLVQRVQALAAKRQEMEQGVTSFADRIAAAHDVSGSDHRGGLWARLFRKSERQPQAVVD